MLKEKISIIIAAYNEENHIKEVIDELQLFLRKNSIDAEIIVVNDYSNDSTADILSKIHDIRVINHEHNKGYGGAIKTAAKNAQTNWLLWYDGDGQFDPNDITRFLERAEKYHMVVGKRQASGVPFIRRPGKALLHFLANFLSEFKIPDLNCGYRIMKRDIFMKFITLLPNTFSISTTLMLAIHKSDMDIYFLPINIRKRSGGKSSVKPKHAVKMFLLILRTILLFSPMRVFGPISILFGAGFIASLIYDIVQLNITDTTILLFLISMLTFFFGLIAEQVATIRREIVN